jgi:NAD+ diphosphatase
VIPASPPAITFAGSGINRRAELRGRGAELAAAFAGPAAAFVPVRDSLCWLGDDGAVTCGARELGDALPALAATIFLGELAGRSLFAVPLDSGTPPPPLAGGAFVGLREVVARVGAADAALLAYARAMAIWQQRHRFCGSCGAPNEPRDAGFVMACTASDGVHRSFPRLDPAVIVLVHRGEECLLGRQASWPEGRFSTVAGFVEPGETLEDAVAREVHEETNVRIGATRYVASQPWPFPAALMIGYHAEATGGELRFNDGELVEARWFTRSALRGGAAQLPPRASIAWQLIAAWCDAAPGPPLASLGLDSACSCATRCAGGIPLSGGATLPPAGTVSLAPHVPCRHRLEQPSALPVAHRGQP